MQNNNKTISRQQMQTMLDNRPQGVDGKKFIDRFVADGFTVEGINDTPVAKTPEKPLTEKLSDRIKNISDAGSGIADNFKKAIDPNTTFQESTDMGITNAKDTAKVIGNTVGLAADTINSIIDSASDITGVSKIMEKAITSLPESVQIQLGQTLLKGEEVVNQLFPDETVRGEVAQALGNILSVAGSVTGAKLGANLLKKAAVKTAETSVAAGKGAVDVTKQVLDKTAGVTKPIVEKVKGVGRNVVANVEDAKKTEAIISALPTKIQQNAARTGIDIADINTLSRLDKTNLPEVKQLVDAAEAFARGTSATDPQEIVGKPLTAKILELAKRQDEVGARLGEISKNLGILDNETVQNSVLKRLQSIGGLKGLKLKENGELDFDSTTLKSSLTASDRSAIETAFKEAIDSGTGEQAHLFRQELFEVLDGKKKSLANITDTQDKALNAIRAGLSDVLEANNKDYKKVSNEYRKIVQPLSDLRKLNKNLTADNENAQDILDISGGLLARRLTSNAVSRPEVLRVLKALDEATPEKGTTAKKLQDLIEAYSVVGKYYDVSPKSSFKGLIEQAGGVSEELMKAAQQLTGVTPAVRQKLLKQMIDELDSGAKSTGGGFGNLKFGTEKPYSSIDISELKSPQLKEQLDKATSAWFYNADKNAKKQIIEIIKKDPSLNNVDLLPEGKFEVYRGYKTEKNRDGLSWTTNKSVAERFGGKVDKMTITKDKVFFNANNSEGELWQWADVNDKGWGI